MKKLTRSNARSPRKLTLRRETVRALRQLSLHEVREAHVVGGSADNCDESTLQPFTAVCN